MRLQLPLLLLLSAATLFNVVLAGDMTAVLEYTSCQADPSTCTRLDLISRQLTGAISTEIGLLTALTFILIGHFHPNLVGTIPTEIGLLTELTQLDLAANGLRGPIPTELGRLTKLDVGLNLDNQQANDGLAGLTGTISTELGLLTSLTTGLGFLGLSGNKLTGPIPTEFGRLSLMSIVLEQNNQLTGSIPSEVAQITRPITFLPSLTTFMAFNNAAICGDVPTGVTLRLPTVTRQPPMEPASAPHARQHRLLWQRHLRPPLPHRQPQPSTENSRHLKNSDASGR
jgi:hypothetical protein